MTNSIKFTILGYISLFVFLIIRSINKESITAQMFLIGLGCGFFCCSLLINNKKK